jgi:hypothetical protein
MCMCCVFMLCGCVLCSCYVYVLCVHVMWMCCVFMLCGCVVCSCYVDVQTHTPRPPFSVGHFNYINNQFYSHVVEPTKSTYGICRECLQLQTQHTSALNSDSSLAAVHARILAHRTTFLEARSQMDHRVMYAKQHPSEVLYIGMDYTCDINIPLQRPASHSHGVGPLAVKVIIMLHVHVARSCCTFMMNVDGVLT